MPLSYYRAPQQSHQSCWQKWDSSPSCHLRIAPVCRQGCIREPWLYSQPAFRNHYGITVLTWQVTLISIPTPAAVASFSAFCRRLDENFQGPTCCKISLWPASKCELEKFVLYSFHCCSICAIGNCTLKLATLESVLCCLFVTKCSAVRQLHLMKPPATVWRTENSPGDARYAISQK